MRVPKALTNVLLHGRILIRTARIRKCFVLNVFITYLMIFMLSKTTLIDLKVLYN